MVERQKITISEFKMQHEVDYSKIQEIRIANENQKKKISELEKQLWTLQNEMYQEPNDFQTPNNPNSWDPNFYQENNTVGFNFTGFY